MGLKQNCYQVTSTLLQQAVSCARWQNHQARQRRHDLKKEYTVVPYQKEKDFIPLVKYGLMGSGAKKDTG